MSDIRIGLDEFMAAVDAAAGYSRPQVPDNAVTATQWAQHAGVAYGTAKKMLDAAVRDGRMCCARVNSFRNWTLHYWPAAPKLKGKRGGH